MEKIMFNDAAITPFIDRVLDMSVPLYTHNGKFHADEVYCTALILLVRNTYNNIKNSGVPLKCSPEMVKNMGLKRIPRVTDNMIDDINDNKIIVYDLLKGQMDHHDISDKHLRPNSNKNEKFPKCYASLGHMWNDFEFGNLFNIESDLTDDVKHRIDRELIFPIDMVDNYGPSCDVQSVRSDDIRYINGMDEDFIPDEIYLSEEEKNESNLTKQFIYAVCIAYNILRNIIISTQAAVKAINSIENNNLIKLNKNKIPYILIPSTNKNEKPLFVNTQTVAEIKLNDNYIIDYPALIVNNNPCERDGSFNVICSNTNKLKLDSNFINNKPIGTKFIHKNLFLMTFDTIEHQMEFIENIKIKGNEITINK